MRDILAWVVAVELLGFAVLPLLRAFFGNRRDAALLSRPMGLALVSYVAWILTLAGLPFERPLLAIAFLMVALAAFLVHRRTREGFPAPFWGSEEKRATLVFWACAAVFLLIRSASPEIFGQEKFMDLAFLNSLTKNTNMPPADPWMAGRTINYYYWGYLLAAAATKLAKIPTTLSYNLALATFAGYSFAAAACLGLRLSRGRWAAGIGGAAATVFAGNVVGALDGWNYFAGRGFDYFHASRVIASGDTINEFPFFTFFQADLHPHLLGFPYFIAAFAVAHRFLVREPAASSETSRRLWEFLRRWSPAALLALVAGTAVAANKWALPAIAILLVVVCAFRSTRASAIPAGGTAVTGALAGGALAVVAINLWRAYESSYHLPFNGLARTTQVSGLLEFLGVWGLLFAVALAGLWPRIAASEETRRRRDLALAAAIGLSLALALAARAPAIAPLLTLALLAGWMAWRALRRTHDAEELTTSFLLLLGLAMIAGCEFIYFKDTYGDRLQRMNTIFKFYNQAWPLLAVATAVLAHRLWLSVRGARRAAVTGLLSVCGVAALLYPAAAAVQRLGQHEGPVTLDGRAALIRRNPADAAAIAWLEHNVDGGTVVLEATGDPYSEYARISTHTGIPTIMGWANHEGLWRGNDPEVVERVNVVRLLYTSRDPNYVFKTLQAFHVTHVVIGDLETRTYPGARILANLPYLDPVFTGPTEVFRVALPKP